MGKESEGNFRKEVGKWAVGGGIIAGIIGLVSNIETVALGIALIAGGFILKKD